MNTTVSDCLLQQSLKESPTWFQPSCRMNVSLAVSEPTVIDEKLLQEAVVEQLPHEQARRIVKTEGIHFSDVFKLRLDCRNILRIDHLWEFTSLVKLDLTNNLIEKIEGLDALVNLTSLNLSANHIEKIEGLESLKKLEVLNLTNNRVSVLENMDTLEELTHFTIANNHLEQLDNVLYVRRFKNLFTLNLFGNPISKDEDYKFFIAAYFPNLMFLDYILLDKTTKSEAAIKYQYALEEMRCKDAQRQKADEAEQNQQAEIKLHTDAFVEFLNGSYLFKSMFKDDPEAEMLHCVPGVAPLLETYESQTAELCMQLFEIGLAEHKRRETEVSSFFRGQTNAMTDSQQKALHMLTKFEQHHKEKTVELQHLSDGELLRVKSNYYNEEMNQLSNSLMALEFQLISQLEDNIKKLDINISDMVGSFVNTVQGIFAHCRDLEDNYHEKVWEIALATLENVAKDYMEVDMPEDAKLLFTDRDKVTDALTTGHDNHLLKINDRETQLITGVNAWKVALIEGIQDKGIKQNRLRVSDIHRYVEHLREQLEEVQSHHH